MGIDVYGEMCRRGGEVSTYYLESDYTSELKDIVYVSKERSS